MSQEEIQKLVNLRAMIIENFEKCKDWRSNRNAIMREVEHVEVLSEAVKQIDAILSGHVTFS